MALRADINNDYFTGTDKTLTLQIVQADGVTAQNITSWDLSWTVKETPDDAVALLTKATGGAGITITDGAAGLAQIALTDADIAALEGGLLYQHELKRTNDGAEDVLFYGGLLLHKALHA